MKLLPVIIVVCAGVLPANAQSTNSAALAGWCRSLSLDLGETLTPGGPAQAAFSTYDGVANTLQVDSQFSIVSDELRPRAGMPGVYEADYGLFRPSPIGFFEFGNVVLTLPTTDADTNGVPDVVQASQAGHVASFNGNGRQEYPQPLDFAVTGQFSRNAGADVGTYNLAWQNITGLYAISGTLRALHLEGQVDYTRNSSNVMRFNFTLHTEKGASLVLTGSTVYTLRSANEVLLPPFKLRSGARRYTVAATTLARAGQRYTGNIKFTDLLLETSWHDFTDWAIEVTDHVDSNTNGIPDLSDPLAVPDFVAPKVGINVPAANARLTNGAVIVQGTASDDRGVARIFYSLNGAPFTNAVGTNLWFAPVTLRPGTNTFVVQAADAGTNFSPVVTRRFIYVVTSPLTVQTSGTGSVMPDLDGRLLEVGRRYTLTAVPAVSNLFASWSGGTNSTTAKLTFTMTSNLVLAANFVPNPFIAIQGMYAGLFAESEIIAHETSGYFSAKLKDHGAYSGLLRRGGRTHSFAGQFGLDGTATNRIRLSSTNQLVLSLSLDISNGTEKITGTVAEGERVAWLDANRTQPRSASNPAGRFPGKYTLSILPEPASSGPAGAGVASVIADTNGNARLLGFLADGTPFSAVGSISMDGHFPLYQASYGGKGSISTWLLFTNGPVPSFSGTANWIKTARPADRMYPRGFTNVSSVNGSLYTVQQTTNALSSAGSATVEILGLPTPDTTNVVIWNRATRMTNAAGMTLTLAPATGLWSGVYPEPATHRKLPFKTTLQPGPGGQMGAGFIIQSNRSGLVNFILTP
ncbi:MAG: Divergent InlB B-repeat domain [Verrucomicrobiota bacterium]|jgi:hypothetical protein